VCGTPVATSPGLQDARVEARHNATSLWLTVICDAGRATAATTSPSMQVFGEGKIQGKGVVAIPPLGRPETDMFDGEFFLSSFHSNSYISSYYAALHALWHDAIVCCVMLLLSSLNLFPLMILFARNLLFYSPRLFVAISDAENFGG